MGNFKLALCSTTLLDAPEKDAVGRKSTSADAVKNIELPLQHTLSIVFAPSPRSILFDTLGTDSRIPYISIFLSPDLFLGPARISLEFED